jgi:prolyl oligopeptidase
MTIAMRTRPKTRLCALLAGTSIGAMICVSIATAQDDDPYVWLETDSPRTLEWITAENEKTAAVLEADPRYGDFYTQALMLAEADDRIPMPNFLGGAIANFWQDADHVRGIWRRTSVDDYANAEPDWQTILDLDAAAREHQQNWVFKGSVCLEPAENRCLVALSDGGEDAVTYREFDVATGDFVAGGFDLPRGKQDVAWVDADTLLVSREWAEGELTASGYPYVVGRLQRGQLLSDSTEIFRGTADDVGVWPIALDDGAGHHAMLIDRSVSFFESEYRLVTADGVEPLALPGQTDIAGLVNGQLIVALREDWMPDDATRVARGSLAAIDLASATADPMHLRPVVIYEPGPRESLQNAMPTRDALVVTTLDNVRGRAALYRRNAAGAWTRQALSLPDNVAVDAVSADLHGDSAFVLVSGFLEPSNLMHIDTANGNVTGTKALPAKFDASGKTVEQFEATSSDGTRVPYFVVHPSDMTLDGSNPTILYAYGGFQSSETPFYSATIGKLWLERSGVFAVANIRGGGEFGPAWHQAALKTHRQRAFDDFAAVARDMIMRGITSPRRLGIQGGSNGGLLMGVELTQHPELFHAVDIQVPLLDMLRFEQIAAGASWVGEYGSVSVPEERAFLASISPYNNLKRGTGYPEPFVWTTSRDDRVGPQHARKFAARLAEYDIPYLFYEATEGGHGSGANLKESAKTRALEMIYFVRKLMD